MKRARDKVRMLVLQRHWICRAVARSLAAHLKERMDRPTLVQRVMSRAK